MSEQWTRRASGPMWLVEAEGQPTLTVWNEATAITWQGYLNTAARDLAAAVEALETIVRGLREGWWGEGSGEMEEGELQQAEAIIAKAKGPPEHATEGKGGAP